MLSESEPFCERVIPRVRGARPRSSLAPGPPSARCGEAARQGFLAQILGKEKFAEAEHSEITAFAISLTCPIFFFFFLCSSGYSKYLKDQPMKWKQTSLLHLPLSTGHIHICVYTHTYICMCACFYAAPWQVLPKLSSRYGPSFNRYISRLINRCSLLTHNKLQYIFLIFCL